MTYCYWLTAKHPAKAEAVISPLTRVTFCEILWASISPISAGLCGRDVHWNFKWKTCWHVHRDGSRVWGLQLSLWLGWANSLRAAWSFHRESAAGNMDESSPSHPLLSHSTNTAPAQWWMKQAGAYLSLIYEYRELSVCRRTAQCHYRKRHLTLRWTTCL